MRRICRIALAGLMAICIPSVVPASPVAAQSKLTLVVTQKYGWEDLAEADRPLTAKEKAVGGGVLSVVGDFAVGPDGRVYVPDGPNHKIVVFNASGSLNSVLGGDGDGPGELRRPVRVTLDDKGAAYVYDMQTNRISHFGPRGEFVKTFAFPGSNATNLDWAAGLLWADRWVTGAKRSLLALDEKTGAVRDSALVMTPQELDVATHGSPPRIYSDGRSIFAASPVPGTWYPISPAGSVRGRTRFPDARGYTRTIGSTSGVRTVTDQVRGFAVRPDGAAVMVFMHRTKLAERRGETPEDVTTLEIIAPNGASRGSYTFPDGVFVFGVVLRGDDVYVGVTDEIPQVWRVRLQPGTLP